MKITNELKDKTDNKWFSYGFYILSKLCNLYPNSNQEICYDIICINRHTDKFLL